MTTGLSPVQSPWPAGLRRVPAEPWAAAPVDPFARDYHALRQHGWYSNLDPTVRAVAPWLEDGALVVDYSGGTGILLERLLAARPRAAAGLLDVDASPKFLRMAAEALGHDERCAFRLLAPRPAGGLQALDEAVPWLPGHADGIVCANAVHLYPDLPSTFAAWRRALRPGGRLHVQSGNLQRPGAAGWTIDGTVAAADRAARAIVRRHAAWAAHRAALDDPARMAAYEAVQRRYFLPVRPLAEYVAALEAAGFADVAVRHVPVEVRLDEWTRFLSVYHEGVLPWVGGVQKVDGRPPSAAQVQDRLALLADGLREAVGGPRFTAEWTYVDAVRP